MVDAYLSAQYNINFTDNKFEIPSFCDELILRQPYIIDHLLCV